jgi:hypothetical protein
MFTPNLGNDSNPRVGGLAGGLGGWLKSGVAGVSAGVKAGVTAGINAGGDLVNVVTEVAGVEAVDYDEYTQEVLQSQDQEQQSCPAGPPPGPPPAAPTAARPPLAAVAAAQAPAQVQEPASPTLHPPVAESETVLILQQKLDGLQDYMDESEASYRYGRSSKPLPGFLIRATIFN